MADISGTRWVRRDDEFTPARSLLALSADAEVDTGHAGQPGTGWPALLQVATAAAAHGAQFLWTSGVQVESAVDSVGLQQLLVPLFADFLATLLPAHLRGEHPVVAKQVGAQPGRSPQTASGTARLVESRMLPGSFGARAGMREASGVVGRCAEDPDHGPCSSAADALVSMAFDALHTGRWDDAERMAVQVVGSGGESGVRSTAWAGRYLLALLAAARGQQGRVRILIGEMNGGSDAAVGGSGIGGAPVLNRCVRHALALAALGRADFDEAYRQVAAVCSTDPLTGNSPQARWMILDLVEAAVRVGHAAAATAHVQAARRAAADVGSPRFDLLLAGAAAIAAPDSSAESLFEEALALPGCEHYPFDVARIRLDFGERLRRARAAGRARSQLADAYETFERLSAEPWMQRAAAELGATGQRRNRIPAIGVTSLTPQERQVAELAAAGRTNKEIGRALYLSPRTVATHLYRVFPKLGITSRAGLRDALTV